MDIKGIKGIENIIQTQKLRKVEKPKDIKRKDEVSFSSEAKRLAEFEKYREIVRDVSGIRADKVKIAKEKIAQGKLISKEVLEKVADRLAEKFMIGDKILENLGEEETE